MEFEINAQVFGRLLKEVETASNKDYPFVSLKVTKNSLFAYCCDTVISVFAQEEDLIISKQGVVICSLRLLNSSIKRMHGEVKVYLEGSNLLLESEEVDYKLLTVQDIDIPQIKAINQVKEEQSAKEVLTMTFEGFGKKLGIASAVTAPPEASKPTLTAVCLRNGKCAATDGRRLVRIEIDYQGEEILIPCVAAQVINKFLPQKETLSLKKESASILEVTGDGVQIKSRTVQGVYSDFEKLFPQEFKQEIKMDKDELIHAIDLISPFEGEFDKVRLSFEGETLTLLTLSAEGSGITEVSCSTAEPLAIILNINFLKEALIYLEKGEFSFFCSAARQCVVIKQGGYNHLLMPMVE